MSSSTLPPLTESDAILLRKLEDYERRFELFDKQIRLLEWERQKFAAIVNHAHTGFLLTDADARVLWANRDFRERFVRPDVEGTELLGQTCNQVLCGHSKICERCPATRAVASGETQTHELRAWVDKHFHHIHVTAMPIHSIEGPVSQAMVMLLDVSAMEIMQRSEEAFRISEERFRSVFERVPVGMATSRLDGSLLQVNMAFCTMLGHTESELLRKKLTDVMHEEDAEQAREQLADLVQDSERTSEVERRYRRRDGSTLWALTTSVLQYDRDGNPAYTISLIQDITERKRAVRELRQSQRNYRALVHSIEGIVWEADPRSLSFSFVSEKAEQILGYPIERWLTQTRFLRNHIDPEDLDAVMSALSRAADRGQGTELEYRMVAADGRTVWLRDTVSVAVEGGTATKLRGVMVDITERKRAEAELQKSQEQLRQAQRMEAIGRLAGGIAHDFNNILTAISGYGDFLVRGLGSSHPLHDHAMEINKASQRAAELTRQLLAFSRQQVLQPEVLDVNAVFRDMEAMLRRVIGEDVELHTALRPDIGLVKADPGQLQQVVLNLAVNARDAMPGGGRLTIGTEPVVAGPEPGDLESGTYVKLYVADTGSGLDEEVRPHLFEPFFTTKQKGKGTGLGLSTVYGIVKQSGGHVAAYNAPEGGAVFDVYLPRHEGDLPRAAGEPESLELSPGTETLLLVEDDQAVRQLTLEILRMSGYTVIEATNGWEALAQCERAETKIDMIVTDLVMPQMGGRDLALRLTEMFPGLKVLYVSGYTDSEVLRQGLTDSGAHFLQKPFTPAALARRVRQILDGD